MVVLDEVHRLGDVALATMFVFVDEVHLVAAGDAVLIHEEMRQAALRQCIVRALLIEMLLISCAAIMSSRRAHNLLGRAPGRSSFFLRTHGRSPDRSFATED